MKRILTHSFKRQLRWLSLVMVMLMGFLPQVQATSTFYFNATVTPSPAGAGKVYVSTEATADPSYAESATTGTVRRLTINSSAQVTLYLYAQAIDDNWIFKNWTDEDGTELSTSPSFNKTVTFNSSRRNNPTKFNYKANFVKQTGLIKVKSDNESWGTVSINNPNNVLDETVTLAAAPDEANGVKFLGWKKDNGNDYISTANPLVMTANDETKGTYTAYFSEPVSQVYVRLQNASTGRFISFYGNMSADVHEGQYMTRTEQDGFIFTNSLKMIDASTAQGNPETVFLCDGNARGAGVTQNADLTAHNTGYKALVKSKGSDEQAQLTLEKVGDVYHIYTTFTYTGNGKTITLNSYLCDEGTDWLVMKAMETTDESADWYVYTLEENTTEGAFGANTKAKFVKDGLYYTTMFADFAYQCLDNVKAYYLDNTATGTYSADINQVNFTEVPDGKVPANMAVVLECGEVQNDFTANKTVVNRLWPLLPKDAPDPIVQASDNMLKGYVSVGGEKVTNNKETMYVLSSKNGVLNFYHSSSATMSPNKAYLDMTGYSSANSVSFFTEEMQGNTDNINAVERTEDDNAPAYDLLGRQKTGKLSKGVYIRNGKKIVVK